MDIKSEYNRLIDDVLHYLTTGFTEKKGREDLKQQLKRPDTKGMNERGKKREKGTYTKSEQLNKLTTEIIRCTNCPLYSSRTHAVPGKGPIDAQIMFIGEAPGEVEDQTGEPFVGKAGQLLTKMIEAIQLKREDVYITNVVKCRPPNNRTPLPDEVAECFPYLVKQIELIDPLIICCLGGPAASALLEADTGISKLRGTIHLYRNIAVIPTYHPAAVLRFPEKYKRSVWNDLKMLRDYYRDVKK